MKFAHMKSNKNILGYIFKDKSITSRVGHVSEKQKAH